MNLELRDITEHNWYQATKLKVKDDQKNYVASNVFSIAQSKFVPTMRPMAAYVGEEMVGFTMFGLDPDDGSYWIWRLMVDEQYQGRGYGKAILQDVIKLLSDYPDCKSITLSYDHDNPAQGLYTRLGFIPTGEIIQDELVARMMLRT